MRVAAEQLTWHDARVDAARFDPSARRLIWQVEVFRWDVRENGDAEPGQVVFEGVEGIEARHDVADEASPEPSWWDMLDGIFERSGKCLRCRFLLELPYRRGASGGPGYGELVVICWEAWCTPAREDTA